ncbi:MAG: HEAT repeat domain-containing protein [Candidatus Eisenbacteria sp.]|nr:HEAT repeat domain-containing protein [Candidatus Eisenbacteria bacterium]
MTESIGGPQQPAGKASSGGGNLEESRQYIDQLRGREPQEAIPKLVAELGNESWYLRERAGEALASFGRAAAPATERVLTSGLWYTRAAALRVLGAVAAPSSLVPVIDFLSDRNRAIGEEAARSLLGYCREGRAVAAAKILHGRGARVRDAALMLLQRAHPDETQRLQRLMQASLMGPEGSLSRAEEQRLAEEVEDSSWQVVWERLDRSVPLPEWEGNLVRFLRGAPGES